MRAAVVGVVVLGLLEGLANTGPARAQPSVGGSPATSAPVTTPAAPVAGAGPSGSLPSRVAISEEAVTAVASRLRCVVCQNLSVADSPSEMAKQMRDVIREQLAAGRTPAEVSQYFVERYGEWVLLVPPPRGFNLVLWALPALGLCGGLAGALLAARRWSRRPPVGALTDPPPGPEDRARIRTELERLRD
jgi:cytochrome c-type biogenesis protein CcmH